MVAPTIYMVTTTATNSEPTGWDTSSTGTGFTNSEINTTTKLDFGTLNIDSNAWSVVKVGWAYVAAMGTGNSSIANMGFYVDGSLTTGMTHYDVVSGTWSDPSATVGVQQTSPATSTTSATSAGSKHTVNRSDGNSTMTAATNHSQYIYCQYYVLSTVPTGQKTTGAGTGRPTFSFTYS